MSALTPCPAGSNPGRATRKRIPKLWLGTPSFTPRHRQLLFLVRDGMSNAEIARRLVISIRTVEKHFEVINQIAGTHSRAQLVAYVWRNNL